jgi:hypothetical protein
VPYRLNDFIGYHEVGHVVIEALGLSQTQGWFNEILATFAAYAFMRDRHPDYARAWDALMQFNIETRQPDFRSLSEFERQYAQVPRGGMSMETLGWFQGMFHVRAAEVYSARGLEFLADLRSAGITAGATYDTPVELLTRLEAIVPGFQRWAQWVEGARRGSFEGDPRRRGAGGRPARAAWSLAWQPQRAGSLTYAEAAERSAADPNRP